MRHDGLFARRVAFFVNDSQGNVWRGGGGRKVFVYICKGVRRWAGAAGDLSLVDTETTGELQFFVSGRNLELFEGSRSGRGGVRSLLPKDRTKMIADEAVLDRLTELAKCNSRLRCNLGLRNSPEDQSQRMLNAIEPGTVMPIPQRCPEDCTNLW